MQDAIKRYWWTIVLGLVLLIVAFQMIEPPPPKEVTIAGGSVGGAYEATAKTYADQLTDKKVTLNVLTTSGSMENLQLLQSGEADIAIVQTGVAKNADIQGVKALGAVFYEPLWVFHRASLDVNDLRALAGLKVAVGVQGSGSRVLAEEILKDNDLGAEDLTLVDVGSAKASEMLLAGEIDAAFIVSGPSSQWIAPLMRSPDVSLASIDRALAYSRRHPFLANIILPDGALSLSEDLPATDIKMIAPTAQIVVRDDLHPAIQSILMEAMFASHQGGGLLHDPKTFPNATLVDLELSKEAQRFFERGPTFLRRYVSFGLANFLERTWVLIIPLITLLLPIVRVAPPLYRWRIRRKIYVWYRDLRLLEAEGRDARTADDRRIVREKLADLQFETGNVSVPDSYTDDLYRLRAHIRFVAELLDRIQQDDRAARV